MRSNCWEYKICGREPNGSKVDELGVCPAAIERRLNGINSGKNGGRCCWAVIGTHCDAKAQVAQASKLSGCISCDFFNRVISEEKPKFRTIPSWQSSGKL